MTGIVRDVKLTSVPIYKRKPVKCVIHYYTLDYLYLYLDYMYDYLCLNKVAHFARANSQSHAILLESDVILVCTTQILLGLNRVTILSLYLLNNIKIIKLFVIQ